MGMLVGRTRWVALFTIIMLLAAVPAVTTTVKARAAESTSPRTAVLGPGVSNDLASLDPATPYGLFVHFSKSGWQNRAATLAAHDLSVTGNFHTVSTVYAQGTVANLSALVTAPGVLYLEKNRELSYLGDTSGWATRSKVAQESAAGGPYRVSAGHVLDGSGVGVAVVDSGIWGEHPDLKNRIVKNFKIVCTTPGLINTTTGQCFGPTEVVEASDTDTTGGHGTHVSGIVAGDGTASKGTYKGTAPGASLFGFGTGEGLNVFTTAEAFQYIVNHYNELTPRIRVVTNSWGDPAGTPYNANSITSQLTRALVAKGVTVLFAAGNGSQTEGGGDGSKDMTSSTSKDPTPGVISVANYDDTDTGSRSSALDSSSSRGKNGDFATYPDVSAPGANIISTCVAVKPVCHAGRVDVPPRWAPYYYELSGTSMATPHVAGVVALLLQARPDLTPA
ncbi:MAG: serine protease AprX, partial [Actinomycetota bacterium]|nr:serine protease AprX [Actinomycetota bacterium]